MAIIYIQKPVNVHVQRQTTNLNVSLRGSGKSTGQARTYITLAPICQASKSVHQLFFAIQKQFFATYLSTFVSRTKRGGFFTIWLAAKHSDAYIYSTHGCRVARHPSDETYSTTGKKVNYHK
jgi:hypothetical protein